MINIDNNNKRVIQSVQRALDIMDCFDEQNKELSLTEISKKLNLHKSTVHGIINTLLINNYISQNPANDKYSLGLKLVLKGFLTSEKLTIKDVSTKYLRYVTEKYEITSHLNLYQNNEIICVEKVTSKHSYYVLSSIVGRTLPLHATASGKLTLAHFSEEALQNYINNSSFEPFTDKTIIDENELRLHLKKIRENGYSIENEEIEYGATSVAVPIYFKQNGNFIGTISITASSSRVESLLEDLIKDLKYCGNEITKALS